MMKQITMATIEIRDSLSPKDMPELTKEQTLNYAKILTHTDMESKAKVRQHAQQM